MQLHCCWFHAEMFSCLQTSTQLGYFMSSYLFSCLAYSNNINKLNLRVGVNMDCNTYLYVLGHWIVEICTGITHAYLLYMRLCVFVICKYMNVAGKNEENTPGNNSFWTSKRLPFFAYFTRHSKIKDPRISKWLTRHFIVGFTWPISELHTEFLYAFVTWG